MTKLNVEYVNNIISDFIHQRKDVVVDIHRDDVMELVKTKYNYILAVLCSDITNINLLNALSCDVTEQFNKRFGCLSQ